MRPSSAAFKFVDDGEHTSAKTPADGLERCIDAHARMTGVWLDQLIEQGDDEDLVSTLHRREAWLAMMQDRLKNA